MVEKTQLGFLKRTIKNLKIGFKIQLLSDVAPEKSERSIISDYFSNKNILGLFIFFMIVRFILVFVPPQFTTDLARSIFYGQQFWKHGFDVYKLTPIQLDPNYNIIDPTTHQLAWPYNKYDYGVVSLFYYALIGLLPFPTSILIIIAKIFFNIADIITFFLLILLYPKNKELPIFFWIIMIPFASIEGQALSITLLFFVSSLYLYSRDRKYLAYIIVALGFHWKYVTLFLLPYYLINDLYLYYSANDVQRQSFVKIIKPWLSFLGAFILLMFPFLVSPYISSYVSFEGNLPVKSQPWNPFYIGFPLTISSFLLLFFIGYIFVQWYNLGSDYKEKFFKGSGFIPLLGLYGFLLIYKYAFPWYWLWSLPLYSILPVKMRKIFLIFALICVIASIEFLNWTVGFQFLVHYF